MKPAHGLGIACVVAWTAVNSPEPGDGAAFGRFGRAAKAAGTSRRGALLARALKRARGSLLWERLWPALATLATALGLFLAFSWAGLWLVLPPLARAIGLVRRSWWSPPSRRRRWRCCGCRASPTACAGSTAAAARRIGRPPRSPTRSPPTSTIRSRRRSGAPMSNARCCRRASSRPAGRSRGCRCAIRWRCARWC